MQAVFEKLWYGNSFARWLLWPFSLLFRFVSAIRRCFLVRFCQQPCPVPLIVVGNLSVGGVGKTPLVIALVEALRKKGLRVGVVSRGYGAAIRQFPHQVSVDEPASLVGDEPLLMARRCQCPVVISPKRTDAVRFLLEKHQCQVIISDDGLQHYAMGRSIEIVVIDGLRGAGNGMCLPAGPLREPVSRLRQADFIVVNQGVWPKAFAMHSEPGQLIHLASGKSTLPQSLSQPVAAIAAIGNPQRFFNTLQQIGLNYQPYVFPDHHLFEAADLDVKEKSVVMTEKDAVKCYSFAAEHWYYLTIDARMDDSFWQALWDHERLKGCVNK